MGFNTDDFGIPINPKVKKDIKNIKTRLDGHDSDLEENATQLNFVDQLKLKFIYGAKGDGVTDDYNAIMNYISANSGKTIYIPKGDYLIKNTINIENDVCLELNKEAKIFTDVTLSYLITYNNTVRGGSSIPTLSKKRFIKGGKLDGAGLVDCLFTASYYIGFTLDDIQFYNIKTYGIKTRGIDVASAAEMIVKNCYFRNETAISGSVAMYNNGSDNHFTDNIVLDVEKAVIAQGYGTFTRIHQWLSSITITSLYENSCFAQVYGQTSIFNEPYIDTVRTSFQLMEDTTVVRINDMMVISNTSFYTSELRALYPQKVFVSPSIYPIINLQGALISLHSDAIFNNNLLITSRYQNVQFYESENITVDYTNYFEYNNSKFSAIFYDSNINNITMSGTYFCGSGDGLSNLPLTTNGNLFVEKSQSMNTQIFITLEGNIYIRNKPILSSVWNSWMQSVLVPLTQTFTNIQVNMSNVISYGTYRAFIPLLKANEKTITLTSVSYMSDNTTTDISEAVSINAKFENGFVIACTNASVAGCVAIVSFTVS